MRLVLRDLVNVERCLRWGLAAVRRQLLVRLLLLHLVCLRLQVVVLLRHVLWRHVLLRHVLRLMRDEGLRLLLLLLVLLLGDIGGGRFDERQLVEDRLVRGRRDRDVGLRGLHRHGPVVHRVNVGGRHEGREVLDGSHGNVRDGKLGGNRVVRQCTTCVPCAREGLDEVRMEVLRSVNEVDEAYKGLRGKDSLG